MPQVPGDEHEWRESLRKNKEASSFAVEEPFPLWLAVAKSHSRRVSGELLFGCKTIGKPTWGRQLSSA